MRKHFNVSSRIASLSLEAFAPRNAGVLGVVRACVTGRIWFDGSETEHVDPAVEARHNRDDIDGIHVAQEVVQVGSAIIQRWRHRDVNNPPLGRHIIKFATCRSTHTPMFLLQHSYQQNACGDYRTVGTVL